MRRRAHETTQHESPRDHVTMSPRNDELTPRDAELVLFLSRGNGRATARTASIVAVMRALATTARWTTTPCYRHNEGATTRPPSPPPPISEIDDGLGGGGRNEEDPSLVLYLALPQERRQHLTMRQRSWRMTPGCYCCCRSCGGGWAERKKAWWVGWVVGASCHQGTPMSPSGGGEGRGWEEERRHCQR